MDEMTLIQLATGPTSSLILLCGIGLALWRVATQRVAPAAARWVDSHLAQVDSLIVEHSKDREAWLKDMATCRDQHKDLHVTLERVERKIGGLYSRLPGSAS